MRLPVFDDAARLRWVVFDDDLAGSLSHGLPLETIIAHRTRIVVAVFGALYGAKAAPQLRKLHHLDSKTVEDLLRGRGTPRAVAAIELAFQNCLRRVRLVPNEQEIARTVAHPRDSRPGPQEVVPPAAV